MAFDVFISYSSHDKPIADAACAALEAANIRCWIAPRDIIPGQDYGDSIITAIEGATVLVLFFSATANVSPQIKREVERAVSKGILIIPVRIEDVTPSGALEYFISSPHWLDAFPPPRERYFAKLIESVRAQLAAQQARPAPFEPKSSTAAAAVAGNYPPAPAHGPATRRRFAVTAAAAAVTALILIAAGGHALYRDWSEPLIRTLTGHGEQADSVSFSPDGKTLAAGGWDATIQIWSAPDGAPQSTISNFYGHAAPYSPDGKTIAGGSNSNVVVWDPSSGRILHSFAGHTDKVLTVAFSTDGRSLVSGGSDNTVFVWDLAGEQPGRRFAGHADQVYSVAFSTDGKRIASAAFDQRVIVWDAASGKAVQTLIGTNKMTAAIFSPDDRWLATAGWDGEIRLFDTNTWQVARVLPGNGQIVTTIAFSRDGKLIASGGYDRTVKVWNSQTGMPIAALHGHTDVVWGVAFSNDKKWIASASGDKTVKIWKTPGTDRWLGIF